MTESMIERVAREIALWIGYSGGLDTMPPGDPGDPRNEAWVEKNFRPFLPSAHFAIKAMREPTTEMYFAGIGNWGGAGGKLIAEALWKAMIDQILQDESHD